MKRLITTLTAVLTIITVFGTNSIAVTAINSTANFGRTLLNNGWQFKLGNAATPEYDFMHGTEYFTYVCKTGLSGSERTVVDTRFDDTDWQTVNLPHDWVVDLSFDSKASHSHGYKCIGWQYPENSVGWYRKHFTIPAEDKGKQIWIEFEGIFRDSQVFCNGFYLGGERSGYTSKVYDLSPYLNYGENNVITVRCNASLEEGWYYEGAGIYRNVWLLKAGKVAMKPYTLNLNGKEPEFETVIAGCCISENASEDGAAVRREIHYYDADGQEVSSMTHRWAPDDPYLYTVVIKLYYDDELSAEYQTRYGVRDFEFRPGEGFLVNGKQFKLKGCNLHLDHAGVGTGVPDELWRYRLEQIKKYGFNAVRCSHNPASPAMLDLCDEMGILVIDENRQLGVNEEQLYQFRRMIDRDRNHPCVIAWSIGNEEWGVEGTEKGTIIAKMMTSFAHSLDDTRLTTYGNSGGHELVKGVDVFGYNYVVQNPVDENHEMYPEHVAMGTEETSGCGTRGKYETVKEEGWMTPLNRIDTLNRINVIEHGWKFYKARPWTAGVFYWTGQDYRGEPNPMKWPATGSQFGILDYCCFPKDEAFYLKAAWTKEPLVHICGPVKDEVWVYSNCERVRLYADGKNLGTQTMPEDGHLVWKIGNAQSFKAIGYKRGYENTTDIYPATSKSTSFMLSKNYLKADGQDIVVINIDSPKDSLEVNVSGAQLLGWGNGNPGFKAIERPIDGHSAIVTPFSGKAQVIIRSIEGSDDDIVIGIGSDQVRINQH